MNLALKPLLTYSEEKGRKKSDREREMFRIAHHASCFLQQF